MDQSLYPCPAWYSSAKLFTSVTDGFGMGGGQLVRNNQILWESEDCSEAKLAQKEVEYIRKYNSNDPEIGYNQWPKYNYDQHNR